MRACVRVRACVRACVRVCVCVFFFLTSYSNVTSSFISLGQNSANTYTHTHTHTHKLALFVRCFTAPLGERSINRIITLTPLSQPRSSPRETPRIHCNATPPSCGRETYDGRHVPLTLPASVLLKLPRSGEVGRLRRYSTHVTKAKCSSQSDCQRQDFLN